MESEYDKIQSEVIQHGVKNTDKTVMVVAGLEPGILITNHARARSISGSSILCDNTKFSITTKAVVSTLTWICR